MKMFIFGAGFTRAVFPDAPLNSELMPALLNKFSTGKIKNLKERYGIDDIEIALTRLDVEISMLGESDKKKRGELVMLREEIENSVALFFDKYNASEDLLERVWINNFIDGLFSAGDVAVSLNYDCLLEGLLDCGGKWTPKGGYGEAFDNVWASNHKPQESQIKVLKIHGSSNFVMAPYLNKPTSGAVNFNFDERYFPRSARNTHFGYGGGNGRGYVIAPSYVKLPSVEINYLMIDALAASSKASRLVIIGTSLRPEDTFLTLIITNFLRQPDWLDRRIIIVDPCAVNIRDRLSQYWGVNVADQIVAIPKTLENSVPELSAICDCDRNGVLRTRNEKRKEAALDMTQTAIKKILLIVLYSCVPAACFFAGYFYSESTKEADLARAVYEEAYDNYEHSLYMRLNEANLIFSLVNNIEKNDYQEFHRQSCLFLKIFLPDIEKLGDKEELPTARRVEIKKDIAEIKEYIAVTESGGNCDWKNVDSEGEGLDSALGRTSEG